MRFQSRVGYAICFISTFLIGVAGAWIEIRPEAAVSYSPAPSSEELALSEPSPIESVIAPGQSPAVEAEPLNVQTNSDFENKIDVLKRLPSFMEKVGPQTFYLSKPLTGGYAYAYWKEDDSIIILRPLYGYPANEQDLYWLSLKARIDLRKDVVPKMLDNMGCCLVTRAWANKIVRTCKSGYRLRLSVIRHY